MLYCLFEGVVQDAEGLRVLDMTIKLGDSAELK
jgi:hypothetical protein